jgi:hypothetical protein
VLEHNKHDNKYSMTFGGQLPLFFWRRDLFFRTKSSLFACISCTSFILWFIQPLCNW